MDNIKIMSVIDGAYDFNAIVTDKNVQIVIPKTVDAKKFIGKTVNISFGKVVEITEITVTK